jgi:hypothetical protein
VTDTALKTSLASRTRLFTRLFGLGFAGWQGGEALTAFGQVGLGFMVSGMGMGLTIVGLILLAGTVLHARKAKAFDLFKSPAIGPASRSALIALGLAMAISAALIGLAQAPQSPLIDLIIAAPVLAFCLHFAQTFKPEAD